MKGRITKIEQGWVVRFEDIANLHPITQYYIREIPLHPDDVNQINTDAKVFDNIEARIAAYPDVDFELCVIVNPDGKGTQYAKLKKS